MKDIDLIHVSAEVGVMRVTPSPTSRPIPFKIDIVEKCLKDILRPINPLNILVNIESIRYYTLNDKLTLLECRIKEKYITTQLVQIRYTDYHECERDHKIETILES